MPTYYSKYDKSHDTNGIAFDAISTMQFAPISIAASQANTTVQGVLAVPQDMKPQKISVATSALTGAATIQIVVGSAAIGAVGTPNTPMPSGTPLTVATIAVPAVNTQTTVVCDVPDAIAQAAAGLPLTVRAVTAAANTATVQISLAVVPVDPSPASDDQTNLPNANPLNF
jgi:hypothetical protein